MSDPMSGTNETREAYCKHCGGLVLARKYVGVFCGGEMWTHDKHNAPSGLPCFGAGVRGRTYRSGAFHRSGNCPSCFPTKWKAP